MSNPDKLGLGKLITTPQERDAIHVAVAPVVAGEFLSPGAHVCLSEGKAFRVISKTKGVGVVDPFLVGGVMEGETFWLFMYPGTITSLRHDWEHPAFPKGPTPNVQLSIDWLNRFAHEVEMSYRELMDGLNNYQEGDDEGICLGTDTPSICYEQSTEMWMHYGVVTGNTPRTTECIFRCAC